MTNELPIIDVLLIGTQRDHCKWVITIALDQSTIDWRYHPVWEMYLFQPSVTEYLNYWQGS